MQLYNWKCGTKKEIIVSLINIRRQELASTLDNARLRKEVVKEIKENLGEVNDVGFGDVYGDALSFEEEDVPAVFNDITKSLKKDENGFIDAVEKVQVTKAIIEKLMESDAKNYIEFKEQQNRASRMDLEKDNKVNIKDVKDKDRSKSKSINKKEKDEEDKNSLFSKKQIKKI